MEKTTWSEEEIRGFGQNDTVKAKEISLEYFEYLCVVN